VSEDIGGRERQRLVDGAREKGLHQAPEILGNYGIDSETDVSVLDQDDLRLKSSMIWTQIIDDLSLKGHQTLKVGVPRASGYKGAPTLV
jgi:hypothetical protein